MTLAPRSASLASVLLLALAVASAAHADAVRPGAAATLALPAATGGSPLARGDNQRTSRAERLPGALPILWKFHIQGGLDLPAVAGGGSVVVTSVAGQLVSLSSANGSEQARTALPAPAVQGPLLTARGDRVVVTGTGEWVAVQADGAIRRRATLPGRARDLQVAPLLSAGGGAVVAVGATLLLLDSEGREVDRTALPEAPVGSLVEAAAGFVAVSVTGNVYAWRPPQAARRLGALGGAPTSAAAVSGRTLIAVVDTSRLVFFDLQAGAPGASFAAASALEGPVAVGAGREAWVTAAGGLLLALSSEGRELERAVLPGAEAPVGATTVAGPGGRLAFARTSGEVVIWSREGELSSEQRVCAEPIGMLADGERLVVSCRDGTVAGLGSRP